MNIKRLFIDDWGLSSLSAILLYILCITSVLMIADTFFRNSCGNYEEVSGNETIYKTLDGCYIKDSKGEWYYRD